MKDATHPSTIRNPEAFDKSPAAGFDGVFDWSWTQGCFGETTISPMDFDGVVERNGNFIVFETKNVGAEVPRGQQITLKTAHEIGCFTIVLVWGKARPELAEAWCAPRFYDGKTIERKSVTPEKLHEFVNKWYDFANTHRATKAVDTTFLNRKILRLSGELNQITAKLNVARVHIEQAVKALDGEVKWAR